MVRNIFTFSVVLFKHAWNYTSCDTRVDLYHTKKIFLFKVLLFHCSLWRWTTSLYRRWRRWLKAYTRLGCVSLVSKNLPWSAHLAQAQTHTPCYKSLLKSPSPTFFSCFPNISSTSLAPTSTGMSWCRRWRRAPKPKACACDVWFWVKVSLCYGRMSCSVQRGGVGIIHRKVFLRWPHWAHVGSGVYEWGPLLWDQAA